MFFCLFSADSIHLTLTTRALSSFAIAEEQKHKDRVFHFGSTIHTYLYQVSGPTHSIFPSSICTLVSMSSLKLRKDKNQQSKTIVPVILYGHQYLNTTAYAKVCGLGNIRDQKCHLCYKFTLSLDTHTHTDWILSLQASFFLIFAYNGTL